MANSQTSALTNRAVPGHRYLAPNVVCMFAEDRPALPKQRKLRPILRQRAAHLDQDANLSWCCC